MHFTPIKFKLVDADIADGTLRAPWSTKKAADLVALLLPFDDDAPAPGSSNGARASFM
jgi:hypothetical protein